MTSFTLAALLSLSLAQPSADAPAPAAARALVVISDLHLGPGPSPGAWHAFEDFRWAGELEAFLAEIDGRAAGPVDLVIAGDMFELWQSVDGPCPPAGPSDLGCTADDARKRFERVVAAHARELDALRAFASHDGNRLVVIPGNHDAVLLYPEVEAVLSARMTGARYEFAKAGWWLTADGRVLVEHGHQVRKDANRFDEWPGFLSDGGAPRLRRTAGEDFVRSIYDAYEAKYPILDNITDEGTGVKLVVAKEGVPAAAKGSLAILKHVLLDSTWAQLGAWLGDDEKAATGEWDYAAARKRGPDLWSDVLPPDDPGRTMFAKGDTAVSPAELSDDDLRLLCDAAAGYRSKHPKVANMSGCRTAGGKKLGGEGGDELGTLVGGLRSRDAAYASYLEARAKAVTPAGGARFQYYVLGHTHRAESFSPKKKGTWKPVVLNDGAWQRIVSPAELKTLVGGKLDASALALAPEDLPAAYGALLVDPGAAPKLVCWSKSGTEWKLVDGKCH